MVWQDIIFTIGSIIFIIALIPSIRGKDKPALSTSLLTGSILFIFSTTYLTLNLTFSTVTTGILASAWLILAFQKYNETKKSTK